MARHAAHAAPVVDRHSRQGLIEGWNQAALSNARVAVVGAGALGTEAIRLLAMLGLGSLLVVDFDVVEPSNLSRCALFRESDVGRPKAECAARRAMEIDPSLDARHIVGDAGLDVGLGVWREMDAVLGCVDSIDARLALNRACLRAGARWLNAGIEPTFGQVARFEPGDGPCFECGMTDLMWDRRQERFSCSGLRTSGPEPPAPTSAITASITAAVQVQEMLRLIGAAPAEGGLEAGGLVTITIQPYQASQVALARRRDCAAHETWNPDVVLDAGPEAVNARDIIAAVGWQDGTVEMGYDMLLWLRCAACGAVEEVLRPLEQCGAALRSCPRCGEEARAVDAAAGIDAESPLATRPLGDMAVPRHAIVRAARGGEERYVQVGGAWGVG